MKRIMNHKKPHTDGKKKRRLLWGKKGETLIETVVSLFIFSLMIASVARIFTASFDMTRVANADTLAFTSELSRVERREVDIATDEKFQTEFELSFSVSGRSYSLVFGDYWVETPNHLIMIQPD